METLRKSVAAGMMICIGAAIYLVNENKVIGAFMFSIGLFTICFFGMFLFTGKIGYVIDNRNRPNCALIWLGNLIGGTVSALLIRFAKPQLFETASQLMEKKFSQNPLATMVLSFFCGVLMYVAVENYRSNKNDVAKIVGIFLCVPTFILAGFEHSIADMCYAAFGVSTFPDALHSLWYILLVSVFNGLGALAVRALSREKNG
jgi:formate/nitrite transporter FocA (FNT family)